MSKNREELCLSSRYIHTGNSGVTISIVRDTRRIDRAEMIVENGAFGAFSTRLEVRGNDYQGMTSAQLQDLGLMFLDAAAQLDRGMEAEFETKSPHIARDDGYRRWDLPRSIEQEFERDQREFEHDQSDSKRSASDVTPERFYEVLTNTLRPIGKWEATNSWLPKGSFANESFGFEASASASDSDSKDSGQLEQPWVRRAIDVRILQDGYRFLTARCLLHLSTDLVRKTKESLDLTLRIDKDEVEGNLSNEQLGTFFTSDEVKKSSLEKRVDRKVSRRVPTVKRSR